MLPIIPQGGKNIKGQWHVLCIKNRTRCGQGEVFKQTIRELIWWHLCIKEMKADSLEMSSTPLVL